MFGSGKHTIVSTLTNGAEHHCPLQDDETSTLDLKYYSRCQFRPRFFNLTTSLDNMAHIQDQKFAVLGLRKSTSSKGVVSYHRGLSNASIKTPILVLLHGYPNSAYLWRHIIPLLPKSPLFVPDLPGYGNSAPPDKHDKVSVGLRILDALKELLRLSQDHPNNPQNIDTKPQPIVLIGHDRGARVAHHLHLSSTSSPISGFTITGLALLDIMPTLSQWSIGDSAQGATGWFHWSFMANPSIAIPMIKAYGGGE